MKKKLRSLILPLISVYAALLSGATQAQAQDQFQTGSRENITYAQQLWDKMDSLKLVGSNAVEMETFYGGARPHGTYLQLHYQNITINGHEGFLVVKKNYNGKGITAEAVNNDPMHYLSSLTVMYQREDGYDEDNQNWFWIKYKPDGSLFNKTIQGKSVPMAGKLFKGINGEENRGCIYCHSSAGGGDYIFYPNVRKP